jgi:hypothetical protein
MDPQLVGDPFQRLKINVVHKGSNSMLGQPKRKAKHQSGGGAWRRRRARTRAFIPGRGLKCSHYDLEQEQELLGSRLEKEVKVRQAA